MEKAARACGRQAEEITIVAVAKTHSLAEVEQVIKLGFTEIGESRVQEAAQKYSDSRPACRLHMIGHLQSNKVRKAVGLFDVIQSVDSVRLAELIDAEAARLRKRCQVLLQVNASGESQKSGFNPQEIMTAADRISKMEHLELSGLMTIGPLTSDPDLIRSVYNMVRKLFGEIKSAHRERESFNILSMGMSDDYELAIEAGANMIRIGRALFGPRAT